MQTELYTVIVAGGSGQRMGSQTPKQFLELSGKPILLYTLEAFSQVAGMHLILVIPEDHRASWEQIKLKYPDMPHHQIIGGGKTRFDSVKNGLSVVPDDSIVLIQDGVRPFVTLTVIEESIAAASVYGSGIVAIDLTDSIREVNHDNISRHVDRNKYKLIQTPQTFQSAAIKLAYQLPYSEFYTDDASVAEAAGIRIHLTAGERRNIKITTPEDLLIAEAFLSSL